MARKSKTKNRSNARKSAGQDGNIHLSRSDRLSTAAKRAAIKVKENPKERVLAVAADPVFLKPAPRLAYWGLVFGLWGGIAAVGIIGFYAAKLPNASDWAIPQPPTEHENRGNGCQFDWQSRHDRWQGAAPGRNVSLYCPGGGSPSKTGGSMPILDLIRLGFPAPCGAIFHKSACERVVPPSHSSLPKTCF